MSNTVGSNGAKREPTIEELEAELARLKQIQELIDREGFTDDRPLVEQFEERIEELREQLAKEQQEREQGRAVEPKKSEEEDE